MDGDSRLRRRKLAGDRLRPPAGPVDDPDLANSVITECRDNRAGRSAGTKDYRRSRRRIPFGNRLTQVFAKPESVGIASIEPAIRSDDDRIDRTDPAGQRVDAIDDGESSLLVRDRQVTAAKPKDRQRTER